MYVDWKKSVYLKKMYVYVTGFMYLFTLAMISRVVYINWLAVNKYEKQWIWS